MEFYGNEMWVITATKSATNQNIADCVALHSPVPTTPTKTKNTDGDEDERIRGWF